MFSPPDSTAEARAGAAGSPGGGAIPAGAGGLGRRERMVLAAVAALLAVLLFWLRGGLHPAAPLERLARQSPDLTTALSDGRPTLVEFYADWCEACRTMAPAMETIEQKRRGALDVVLLNVDNPRWQPELERYGVNGIPQLELFDAGGHSVGRSIGARRPEELEALTTALVEGKPLPQLVGVGATSSLEEASGTPAASGGEGAGMGTSGAADRSAASGASSMDGSSAKPSTIADSPPSTQPGRRAVIGPRSHG
ncbi:MAG: thioredoxin domain-containing protein [Cyanobacteria bacterium]|nr:thioredoxin domain-containing protein [Cyanobacteriota bacterium]